MLRTQPFFGGQTNKPQQPGPKSYMPAFQGDGARAPYPMPGPPATSAPGSRFDQSLDAFQYGRGVNAQVGKDTAAFGALQNLGIAGQNAMGQYGAAQANALLNSQIAQANTLGQLGSQYYNTMGQLGQANAGMTAAASQARGAAQAAGALGGLFGGDFSAGFSASGPEGLLASGQMARRRPVNDSGFQPDYRAGGRGRSNGGSGDPFDTGTDTMRGMLGMLHSKDNMPNLVRNDINAGFGLTQKNLMDPGIRDSLNAQMGMGYGALGNLYGQSDYGFNTGAPTFRPRYSGGKRPNFRF